MAFNRRGPRRPDRGDRGGRRTPGDWQPPEPRSRDRDRPYAPRRFERRDDEGGMSLRLDPRRLTVLKRMAAEAGLRPGEMARQLIEERIDAERSGEGAARPPAADALAELRGSLKQMQARLEALESAVRRTTGEPVAIQVSTEREAASGAAPEPPAAPRPRGRPRKTPQTPAEPERDGDRARVPLHEEIMAVIAERGPSTAAEIAAAILERGRYAPPRTGKPLDAAMVNGRVSNPVYRSRFVRSDGRIGLAEPPAL